MKYIPTISSLLIALALQRMPCLADPATTSYPKVNLAAGYKAVPEWPQRPDGSKWHFVTGVAVDAQDHVWLVNQFAPQVQVFDPDGKLINSWGQSYFKAPHYLRIDHEGNIWIADYERHIVQKF